MNKIQQLTNQGLISPPTWLPANVMYLTVMGSTAYGVSTDESDYDVYGFAIPKREMVFPHLAGEIFGFGRQIKRFEQYQQHHIFAKDELGGKGRNYDIAIYSIVKYFQLVMENNPNLVDSLFTPSRCVLHRTQIWEMIREKREMFLHKGSWFKFKGYAYSQLNKMRPKFKDGQQVFPQGKRKELVQKYGYDIKFAYHVVRLLCEIEQILTEHTLDLERSREQLKSIRRGEWALEEVEKWFAEKEPALEKVYNESTLPHSPDEDAIKELLLNCLEHHYGNLSNAVVIPGRERNALLKIREIVEGAL